MWKPLQTLDDGKPNKPFVGCAITGFDGNKLILTNSTRPNASTLYYHPQEIALIGQHLTIEYGEILNPMVYAERLMDGTHMVVPYGIPPIYVLLLSPRCSSGSIAISKTGRRIVCEAVRENIVMFDQTKIFDSRNPTSNFSTVSMSMLFTIGENQYKWEAIERDDIVHWCLNVPRSDLYLIVMVDHTGKKTLL